MNVSMPVLSGFDAARVIKNKLPESSSCRRPPNKHSMEEAKKVGARAYVAKTKIGEALIVAICEAVESGEFVLLK